MATQPPYLPPPSDLPRLNEDITKATAALERSEDAVTQIEDHYVSASRVRDRAKVALRSLVAVWERMRTARLAKGPTPPTN